MEESPGGQWHLERKARSVPDGEKSSCRMSGLEKRHGRGARGQAAAQAHAPARMWPAGGTEEQMRRIAGDVLAGSGAAHRQPAREPERIGCSDPEMAPLFLQSDILITF